MSQKDNRVKLKFLLKELIDHIDGPYFVGDGALLGLIREGDLLAHDNDIDLFLLPGTKINMPEDSMLKLSEYYMDSKVSDKFSENYKPKNSWKEFLDYTRMLPENKGINRAELFKRSSAIYKERYIIPQFSLPYIDIFYLYEEYDRYIIPYWTDTYNQFYHKSEAENLVSNYSLGFEVKIPSNSHEILRRQYGNWQKEDVNFRY